MAVCPGKDGSRKTKERTGLGKIWKTGSGLIYFGWIPERDPRRRSAADPGR